MIPSTGPSSLQLASDAAGDDAHVSQDREVDGVAQLIEVSVSIDTSRSETRASGSRPHSMAWRFSSLDLVSDEMGLQAPHGRFVSGAAF